MDARRVTNDLLSAIEDGFLTYEEVCKAALHYLSEDDVRDMVKDYDWHIADDEDLDEESIFNDLHAREWMERYPNGWYNNEDDKGTGYEDDYKEQD